MSRIGKKSQRSSFTLIELVLVILLISILTAISTPLFRRTFSDLIIKNAAFDLAKMVNYAQEMAIIEKVAYKMNFDFEGGKYWLTRYGPVEGPDGPSTGPDGSRYGKIEGRYGRDYFLPRGLGLSCDKEGIVFYPDGRSDEAEIKISDEKGETARFIRVKGFANRVKIVEVKE
jgi:Tfp pilus assembly protein FimT